MAKMRDIRALDIFMSGMSAIVQSIGLQNPHKCKEESFKGLCAVRIMSLWCGEVVNENGFEYTTRDALTHLERYAVFGSLWDSKRDNKSRRRNDGFNIVSQSQYVDREVASEELAEDCKRWRSQLFPVVVILYGSQNICSGVRCLWGAKGVARNVLVEGWRGVGDWTGFRGELERRKEIGRASLGPGGVGGMIGSDKYDAIIARDELALHELET
ncbi:hypothetical protein Tco_1294901 [Tanacetum coccineum]